jgi:drug/metabolite transporter (DMT)-like permease
MIFLLLSVMCSVSIAHLFKYSEGKTLPKFGLFAVNYFVGSAIALLGSNGELPQKLSAPLLTLGVVVGVLFVCSYILMILTIKKLGVTIPVSLMRLSAVLPTFGSIIFFSELPKTLQVAGILLAFLSLPLASEERIVFTNLMQIMDNGFGWGLMLFFVYGVTNFIFKIQREIFPLENPYHFLAIIFPMAFLVSASVAVRQKTRITKTVLLFGCVLGILNLFANYFLMKALQELSGIVVYPTNGIGTILLSAITSIILWKERLTRGNYGFITLASIALLLIYPR